MSMGIIEANLFAIILESNFVSRFSREIGRYDPGAVGSLSFLGISLMWAWKPVGR